MIEFYTPTIDELCFREKILNDSQTMSYNHAFGGTILFPAHKWKTWYQKWIANNDKNYFYRYIRNESGFVGEAAYHFDAERNIYLADVIVFAPCRGKGYGRQALLLLCECAKNNGINEIFDNIAIDNPAISLFTACGFEESFRTDAYVLLRKTLSD